MDQHNQQQQDNYTIRYYHELNCSFWDSPNQINTQYKNKQEESQSNQLSKTIIYQECYNTIINPKSKSNYLKYLFLNFIFSQPNNLEILKKSFFCYVFPAYVFALYSDKNNFSRLLFLDYTSFTLIVYDKGQKTITLDIDSVDSIMKQEHNILLIQNQHQHQHQHQQQVQDEDNKKTKMLFQPAIPTQCELIYTLILFMAQLKEQLTEEKQKTNVIEEHSSSSSSKKTSSSNRKKLIDKVIKVEETINIKDLIAIKNDFYLPSGIVLRAKVYIDKVKKHPDFERYIILGNSSMGIFKDESMSAFLYLIPLIPCNVLFTFKSESNLMKIIVQQNELNILFNTVDEMQIWQMMIHDLADGRIEEKIREETLVSLLFDPLYFNPGLNVELSPAMATINQQIEDLEIKLDQLKSKAEDKAVMIKKDSLIDKQNTTQVMPSNTIFNNASPIINEDNFEDFLGSIKNEMGLELYSNLK